MEVRIIPGKRKGSQIYFFPPLNEIFVLKKKTNNVLYLECYHKDCQAKGNFGNNQFHYNVGFDSHNNHNFPTSTLITYFTFFNELREKSCFFGKPLKLSFDETYLK